MNRQLAVVLTAILLAVPVGCDAPQHEAPLDVRWETELLFAANWYVAPSAVLPAGGGYLLVTTWSDTAGYTPRRLLLARFDSSGDTLWTRRYAPTDTSYYLSSWGVTALPAANGGWLVVGSRATTAEYQPGAAYLVRTDSLGDTLWTRLLADSVCTYGPAACAAADGACWVATWNYWDSLAAVRVSLVDSTGNVAVTRNCWPRIQYDNVYICPAPDGGFLLAVTGAQAYPRRWARLRLLRADRAGDTLWTYASDTLYDSWLGIAPTDDGGCIAVGTRAVRRWSTIRKEACLVKFNSSGELEWENHAGYEWFRRPLAVQQLDDGGYLYAGRTSVDDTTAFLCRTDDRGNEMWFSTLGEPIAEADCFVPTGDGDYVVTGHRIDPASWQYSVFLARVSPSGD